LPGRVRRVRDDKPTSALHVTLVEEPYYAHWCACLASLVLFVPALVVWGVLRAAHWTAIGVADVALGCWLASALLAVWGVFLRRRFVTVRTVDVPVRGLAEEFEGYRIAQLSDLHVGSLWPLERARSWTRRLAGVAPDLVALTGDYVTSGTAFHADIATLLGEMGAIAPDGAIAVLGNHDYFGDAEPLVTLLKSTRVRVLRNERELLERGGATLCVAGVDDTWTRRADVARTLEGRDAAEPLIALAHDPQLFPELARGGASLVMSGHTHWGQVALPFFPARFNLSRLSYRFHAGAYRDGDAMLYVNPGLGTTGPPLRLGAAPEITVFRLRRAA
ncbi:MAG TPA: metallophosphoesterase, partial [Byssovorax sp.]